MLKCHLKTCTTTMDGSQVKHIAVLAFLFLLVSIRFTSAQINSVSGAAYGTNDLSTAASIASVADGEGFASIGYTGTVDLVVQHNIDGYVVVSNQINGFSLQAANGSVSSSDYAALMVIGGTNLSVTGGAFIGSTAEGGIILPPFPGEPAQTNFQSSAAMGGLIYGAKDALLNGSMFSGTNYTANSTTSIGTDGLQIIESSVVLSNATLRGGNAPGGGTSIGGAALYAQNASVEVMNGTLLGGSAGSSSTAFSGEALHATNSTITVGGSAQLTGGDGAAAVYARNSDLTVTGGTFQGGAFGLDKYFGLVSLVDAGTSNTVVLSGGTFNSVDFAGSGLQFLTVGNNLTVEDLIVVDGATLMVDNQSNDALQDILIRDGSMHFANDFSLRPGGLFTLDSASSLAGFSTLDVQSNAVLWIDQGAVDVASDFRLAGGGTLFFSIMTNRHGALMADTALFQTNATIQIDATAAGFTQRTNDLRLVSTPSASGISVLFSNGTTNTATGSNLASNLNVDAYVIGRTVLSDIFSEGGSNVVFRFSTQSLQDYWNVTGQMADLASEIEGDSQMALLIDQYDDPDNAARAVEQTYFTTFNNYQTALQGMRSAVGPAISRGSEFREQLKLIPMGARGPEQLNQLRGWVKYYGQYYTHDEEGLNPDYASILHGGSVGIDTSIGRLLVGISGGSSHYRIDQDNDARSDTVAYHGNLYATYGMERGYLDAGVAYGFNQVDTRTADPFRLEGSFDADVVSAYLGGGYDLIDTQGGTVFTPEASLQYAAYRQDAYNETGVSAIPRMIDEFDADSILTTLGMNISMLQTEMLDTFAFKVDGRLHWMHEFNPDPSNLFFTLQGGNTQYSLPYPSLDEDIYRVGIGCAFFNPQRHRVKNVMLRIDFDELFNKEFNSHNLMAKLVYAF